MGVWKGLEDSKWGGWRLNTLGATLEELAIKSKRALKTPATGATYLINQRLHITVGPRGTSNSVPSDP